MSPIILPDNLEYFNNQIIVDVLDYYDGTKAYTFFTQSNDFFFAYFGNDTEEYEEWLFVPTNESTIERLAMNEITIRNFFELSHFCYLVNLKSSKVTSVQRKYFLEISEYIPKDDIYIGFYATKE
jgi:hypothetical protein